MNFKHLDLRFDNKCNLKCRICNPGFSSALYKEYKDLGFNNFTDFGSPYSVSVNDEEFQFILSQLGNVETLFFAGGEISSVRVRDGEVVVFLGCVPQVGRGL